MIIKGLWGNRYLDLKEPSINDRFSLLSWNMCGANVSAIEETCMCFRRKGCEPPLMCIQEYSMRPGLKDTHLEDNSVLYMGKRWRQRKRLATLVPCGMKLLGIKRTAFCMVLCLPNFMLINVHLPAGAYDVEYASAVHDIDRCIYSCKFQKPIKIIAGDFNVHSNCSMENMIGEYGVSRCPAVHKDKHKKRAEMVSSFLLRHRIVLASSFRDLGPTRTHWDDESGGTDSVIDHIGISTNRNDIAIDVFEKDAHLKNSVRSAHLPRSTAVTIKAPEVRKGKHVAVARGMRFKDGINNKVGCEGGVKCSQMQLACESKVRFASHLAQHNPDYTSCLPQTQYMSHTARDCVYSSKAFCKQGAHKKSSMCMKDEDRIEVANLDVELSRQRFRD